MRHPPPQQPLPFLQDGLSGSEDAEEQVSYGTSVPLLGTQQTSRDLSQALNTSSTCELLVLHADHPLLGASPTCKLLSPQPLSVLVLPGRCSLRRDYLLLLLRKLTSSGRRGALNALSVVCEACANSPSPGRT